jgi:hypothetical protein
MHLLFHAKSGGISKTLTSMETWFVLEFGLEMIYSHGRIDGETIDEEEN